MQTGLVGQRERRSREAKQASERPSAVLCNGSQKEISYLVLQRCVLFGKPGPAHLSY